MPNSLTKDNTLTLGAELFVDDGEVYSHETGHNFALLHTFGVRNIYKYPHVLTNSAQIDHPYSTDGFARELAIRDNVPVGTKNFNLVTLKKQTHDFASRSSSSIEANLDRTEQSRGCFR